MKKILLRSLCLVIVISLLAFAVVSCSEEAKLAKRLAELDEPERAEELYKLVNEALTKKSSFAVEQTMNITARIANMTTVVSAKGETTVMGLDGEDFSIYTEVNTDMEVGTTKEKVSVVSIDGYNDGKMFTSNVSTYEDEEKNTEKKLWSYVFEEEYIEYLSSLSSMSTLELSKDSCRALTCVQNEDKGWTATYTRFSADALSKLNGLLDGLDEQFDEGHDLADANITLVADENILPRSIDIELIYEDNDGDKREDAPVITISAVYKDFDKVTETATVSLEDYTEVDDLRLIKIAERAIHDKLNSENVSFVIDNFQQTSSGINKQTSESEITGEYSCRNGEVAYNVVSKAGNITTVIEYSAESRKTKYAENNVVRKTETAESTDKAEYAFISSLINSGNLSSATISDISIIDEEKGIYEFDISDYMIKTLEASVGATPNLLGKTTVTLTISEGELIKYVFYSNYSITPKNSSRVSVITSTECWFE